MITRDDFIYRAKNLETKYNKIIRKPETSRNQSEEMVLHEIKTKLSSILGFYELLKESHDYDENFEKALPKLTKSLDLSEKIIGLADIKPHKEHYKRKDLLSGTETSARTVLKELVKSEEDYLEKNNIQVKFIGNDGETNLKPAVLYSLLGTLFGNAIKFTVPNSQINLFVRTYKDNFTLEMENYHDANKPRRADIGLGKGLGKEFSEKIIKALNGKVEKTDKPFFMLDNSEKDFYGIRFQIPKVNARLENIVEEDDN